MSSSAKKSGSYMRGVGTFGTLIVVIIIISATFVFIIKGWNVMIGITEYSQGYRDGYVQKVTTKGSAIKFWEIEVGFHGHGGHNANKTDKAGGPWTANFEDPKIADELKKIRGDELVRLHYEEKFFQLLQSTGYSIVKVERLSAPQEQ